MIILDTNVVSEIYKPKPETRVIAWLDSLPASELFITSTILAELTYGAAQMPVGRRRTILELNVAELINSYVDGRVLPFDLQSALVYGEIVARCERKGHPINMADAQIAAVCLQHGATLATRNVRDFGDAGIELFEPWTALPQ